MHNQYRSSPESPQRVPGLLIAGTHSGCGKTTLVAGLLRAFRNQGIKTAPFKCGPDFLDPQLHHVAAGRSSWNLDTWFMDDEALRETYMRGSCGAELAVIEGVMGLFDGADHITFAGSSADIATRLGIPVILVVDASGVGGSVAAMVLGHTKLWPNLNLAGVIFNRVSNEGHYRILKEAVEKYTNVAPLGYAAPNAAWRLPERYLGIHRPSEIPDLDRSLDALAYELSKTIDMKSLCTLATPVSSFITPVIKHIHCHAGLDPASRPILDSRFRGNDGFDRYRCQSNIIEETASSGELTVGLAWDEAFSFAYADTLDRMERLGVRWVPFSPLRDRLPEGIAGLYLPGGYPELHAEELSRNSEFRVQLKRALGEGMPCYAECGGLMVLTEALVTLDGRTYEMTGAIPGKTRMTEKLQRFGYKELEAANDTLLSPTGSKARGHEFHCSVWEDAPVQNAYITHFRGNNSQTEGYAQGNLLATYCHLHFASAPAWAERWVEQMRAWKMQSNSKSKI